MLNAVRIWILFSALLVSAGWILSAFHKLNGVGYGIVFTLAMTVMFWRWRQPTRSWCAQVFDIRTKFWRRFSRAAPLIFLILTLLTLAAGAWYAPSNGSSIVYRIPRVMHWLASGQWHWIRTLDVRMNIAGCDYEWLCAPLILLTHTDRWLFLPNWISFLLLPGLIFSVFTRLGVRPRVAWWWMWLLPSGWCFIMQANSTINDALAASYALAAVDLGLRARKNRNVSDLWLALLAAALATGVKQTDILLAAPGLIAVAPGARTLLKRPVASLAVAAMGLLVSAAPMMILNWEYVGTWSGVSKEAWDKAELHSPLWGFIGNTFCLTVQNLKPPVFPFVNTWDAFRHHFLQTTFGRHFAGFEDFGRLSFGVSETSAALGLGVSALTFISLLAAQRHRRAKPGLCLTSPDNVVRLVRWIPWLLLLVFMVKVGTFENGRQLASYYILLFPSLLTSPVQSIIVRQQWWRALALAVLLIALLLVVVSRDRPLFPSEQVVGWLTKKSPESKLAANISLTYGRTPLFETERLFVRGLMPPGEKVVGYAVINGELETCLWLPYGHRRVQLILPGDSPDQLRAAGIRYAVLDHAFLPKSGVTLEQWLARYHAMLLRQWEFLDDPYAPPLRFYLVRLEETGPTRAK